MDKAIPNFKQYLARRYPKRSTTKHYISDLRIFHQFVGDKSAREITPKMIDEFVQAQSEQGLKESTLNRRLASLSSFFDYLISEAESDDWPNPVRWRRHGVKAGQHLPRDVSDETVRRLFAVIADVRDRAIFTLMISAGLRVGEVVTLQVDDVQNDEANVLGRLRVWGKGHKERVVWLTPEARRPVQVWLQQRPPSQSSHLFLNQHGRPLSVSGVQYRLKQYCQQAQVQVSCHQLRHTFARRLAEQQMPLESLAKLLGHRQLQTTQLYIDGADPKLRQDFQQAIERLPDHDQPCPAAATAFANCPGPAVEQRPKPEAVWASIAHLGAQLPPWLFELLRRQTLRRMPRWAAHRLPIQAYNYFGSLCRTCGWLVQHRAWSRLEQLSRADLTAYVNYRHEAGFKPQSTASELKNFRGFWRDLLDQEVVTNGALLLVKDPVGDDPLPRYLTLTEFQRLQQHLLAQTQAGRARDLFDRAWFYLLAHTGLRLSELLNLRLHDCDLAGQRLRVQAGKGNRDRVLPVTKQVITAISHYLPVRETALTDHLLIHRGALVKRHVVPYRLRLYGRQVAIEPMSPHRLRHTLATFLINQGMSIVSLQKFLGHQDINKTLIYARVHDETVRQHFMAAMAQVEAIALTDWPVQLAQLDLALIS